MKKRIQALKSLRKWKFTKIFNPLLPIAYKSARIDKISILKLEGIIKKNFLWASRLWVGRGKKLISGYVSKNYEKKNSGTKGFKKMKIYKFL